MDQHNHLSTGTSQGMYIYALGFDSVSSNYKHNLHARGHIHHIASKNDVAKNINLTNPDLLKCS